MTPEEQPYDLSKMTQKELLLMVIYRLDNVEKSVVRISELEKKHHDIELEMAQVKIEVAEGKTMRHSAMSSIGTFALGVILTVITFLINR